MLKHSKWLIFLDSISKILSAELFKDINLQFNSEMYTIPRLTPNTTLTLLEYYKTNRDSEILVETFGEFNSNSGLIIRHSITNNNLCIRRNDLK